MSLPATYQNELNTLTREVAEKRPDDVLQFCANFFFRRLESQRQELLLQSNRAGIPATPQSPISPAKSTFGGRYSPTPPAVNKFATNSHPVSSPFASKSGLNGARLTTNLAKPATATHTSNQSIMAASAGPAASGSSPFGTNDPFGSNKSTGPIQEEEESFNASENPADSNTNTARAGDGPPAGGSAFNNSSPFSNSSPFGGSGGVAWGSPFGSDPNGNAPDDGAAGAPSGFPGTGNGAQSTPNYGGARRTSVSAESLQPTGGDDNWRAPYHHKTDDQIQRLRTAVSSNFLFSHLDEDSFKTVLGALVEKPIPAPNIKVITQGDAGDYFYVVEKGEFDIYIHPSGTVQPGANGLGNKVATIGPGGSFGELALMYNAPRAATVISRVGKCTLWALDRVTFRRILMDSAFKRRRMYESFLEEVPLLSSLKTYERAKIADALESVKFSPGATIIREGDRGDAFFLLEAGEANAFKAGVANAVKSYTRGDYFGELALLDDKPRAASVVAQTSCKVAKLDRDGFKRLLGPVESIMRREDYVDPLAHTKTAT